MTLENLNKANIENEDLSDEKKELERVDEIDALLEGKSKEELVELREQIKDLQYMLNDDTEEDEEPPVKILQKVRNRF